MVQRKGGFRRKTRSKLSKSPRQRGKISIRNALQTFGVGDKVTLSAEPARQSGMYHPRFHGKAGVVSAPKGECYIVSVLDGNKRKALIIHPIHLRRMT